MLVGAKENFRTDLREWLHGQCWHSPYAVTFTLRQCITVLNGTQPVKLWLDDTSASQNFRHFLNKLNRSIYGKAAQRFGKSVTCIPIREGGLGKRWHYHAMIGFPDAAVHTDLPLLIGEAWRSTQWGYWSIDCQPDADGGWLNYITKYRDKSDFADAIDWVNVRLQ